MLKQELNMGSTPEPTYSAFKIVLIGDLKKWVDAGWLQKDTWPGKLTFVLLVK